MTKIVSRDGLSGFSARGGIDEILRLYSKIGRIDEVFRL